MGDDSLGEALAHFQADRLVTARTAHVGGAAEGVIPRDVYIILVLQLTRHEANARLRLVLVKGLGNGDSLAERKRREGDFVLRMPPPPTSYPSVIPSSSMYGTRPSC